MLSLSDITVQIGGSTLIHQVDLTVQPGTLTAVVGPNGAGKTTLLRVASGELTPSTGTVSMDDQPLAACSNREVARRRAVLAQQSHLRFAFPVLQVVLMGRTPHLNGAETARDWQIAESALAAVGLADFAERSFPTLSGGEQQRVQLARALAQIWTPPPSGNRYLLLDEPTASLDLAHQHRVLTTAAQRAQDGVGVLAILHDLNLAAQYADQVVMLRDGQVYESGAPAEVLTPSAVQSVFGCPVCVIDHPTQGCPLIVAERDMRAAPDHTASPHTFASH
ncbi:heme ABC transporter ATP-binding protein [Longimonas halophila]|uniref:Heme ABC transporter ATP-binding protein n=1 Tax=Longimonas halophila TaxID=1469170 RepID=A0A2H3NMA5_9BACT|nr:heme ABC transporter ATP-binding protein [Longimonas halophila]PEN07740.1 heme ABC transporter ATP-binding protein [Longimonas halophila]